MLTREEYITQRKNGTNNRTSNYQIVFKCPKCGEDVVKDSYNAIQLTCNPPITKNLCKCMKCDYLEYI